MFLKKTSLDFRSDRISPRNGIQNTKLKNAFILFWNQTKTIFDIARKLRNLLIFFKFKD